MTISTEAFLRSHLVAAALLGVATVLTVALISARARQAPRALAVVSGALVVVYLVGLAYLTLRNPSSVAVEARHQWNLIPGSTLDELWNDADDVRRQALGNLVLCAPLGCLLPLASQLRLRGVFVAATITACAVEAIQFAQGSSRVADVNDVILNVAGATALGWAFWAVHDASRARNERSKGLGQVSGAQRT